MVGLVPHQAEFRGSQWEDHFVNLKRRWDQEGRVRTTHTSKSHSRGGSYLSHEKNTKVMQQKIDRLKRELLREWRSQSLTVSDSSSNNRKDDSYKRRSRTPPSESFSHDEEYHHGHGNKNSSSKRIGNGALSNALKKISKSPFTQRIEEGRLPRRFTQPTFTAYNGRTDPVKHVNHFNQRMADFN